jgi:hypothetical protein
MREIAPREREKFHHEQKRRIPTEKRCFQPRLIVSVPAVFDLSKQIKVEGREAYSVSSHRDKSENPENRRTSDSLRQLLIMGDHLPNHLGGLARLPTTH